MKSLGKDVAVYGAGEFAFKFIAFAVFPIYAHVFSVAEFGLWGLLTVSASLLGYVVNMGVNQAVQRYYFDPDHSDTAPMRQRYCSGKPSARSTSTSDPPIEFFRRTKKAHVCVETHCRPP